jgi:hypothetical protein
VQPPREQRDAATKRRPTRRVLLRQVVEQVVGFHRGRPLLLEAENQIDPLMEVGRDVLRVQRLAHETWVGTRDVASQVHTWKEGNFEKVRKVRNGAGREKKKGGIAGGKGDKGRWVENGVV